MVIDTDFKILMSEYSKCQTEKLKKKINVIFTQQLLLVFLNKSNFGND